jgi:hypothetical protein
MAFSWFQAGGLGGGGFRRLVAEGVSWGCFLLFSGFFMVFLWKRSTSAPNARAVPQSLE